jgi:hypothetical protein
MYTHTHTHTHTHPSIRWRTASLAQNRSRHHTLDRILASSITLVAKQRKIDPLGPRVGGMGGERQVVLVSTHPEGGGGGGGGTFWMRNSMRRIIYLW